MDGTGEAAKPSPKDLGLVGSAKDKAPKEENRKDDRLIEEALRSGISRIYTWVVMGGDDGYAGWQAVSENGTKKISTHELGKDIAKYVSKLSEQERRDLPRKGVKELVIFKSLEADVLEEKTVRTAHKKLFRTTYKESVESQIVGKRAQTLSEVGSHGETPAAAIYYVATDRESMQSTYYDARRRPGNEFDIKFIVPLDLANRIAHEIQENPKLIRKMAAAFIERNYPQEYVDTTWNRFGRPPYEQWDNHPDAAIYFANRLINPEAGAEIIRLSK